jgi:hypothetical protein
MAGFYCTVTIIRVRRFEPGKTTIKSKNILDFRPLKLKTPWIFDHKNQNYS